MDIKNRIKVLEQEIAELRTKYKSASPAMRLLLVKEAKNKNAQIHVFESVLRRRGDLPPKPKQESLI